jgi:DNA-binding NarL/FixJ family response regulator
MRMIASGKSLAQIGTSLSISAKTVSVYRARVLCKMRLRNNAELMHYALANRLIELAIPMTIVMQKQEQNLV